MIIMMFIDDDRALNVVVIVVVIVPVVRVRGSSLSLVAGRRCLASLAVSLLYMLQVLHY